MPIPRVVGRLNKVGFNRVSTPVARRLGGFAVVHHVGRRSGRAFRTPVNLFPTEGGYVIALTYGPDTDWVKNILAAGGCDVETRGRRVPCTRPRVYRDPGRRHIRPVEAAVLRLIGVEEFLSLEVADVNRRPTTGQAPR